MSGIVLSATGLYIPPNSISNEELVASFNKYVDRYNAENPEIPEPLRYSSADFIEKASGIQHRYVVEKSGILDIDRMQPYIDERPEDHPSIQCEMSVLAAKEALDRANILPSDIDAVITASSNIQRPYPAIAIEVQNALNINGFAFDMVAGCASATFAIQNAVDAINRGTARTVLIVNPEIMSGHVNFRDRDSHFIFGDACSAILLQRAEDCRSEHPYQILGTRLKTQFSNNIRNNFGFLTPLDTTHQRKDQNQKKNLHNCDRLFKQQGRKVFKDVVPFVAETVQEHLTELGISAQNLRRLWLHQANVNMDRLIATKILNREPDPLETPIILDEYANTSSPGAIIAFHKYHADLKSGDIGILCAFGAGYSVGNVVLKKV